MGNVSIGHQVAVEEDRTSGLPKVGIVILNWNGYPDTQACMESLAKVTYPHIDICLMDNASAGDEGAQLKLHYANRAQVLENRENIGFAGGCNVGMRVVLDRGADYVLLLNNDTVVDPGFLEPMVQAARESPQVGIVGAKLYEYSEPDRLQFVGGKIRWWLGDFEFYGGEKDRGQYDGIVDWDFVVGAALLIKKDVIEKIGPLDPFFFFDTDDIDWCVRARQAGYRVVCAPASKVWHKGGASRETVLRFPDTWQFIRKTRGFNGWRYAWRLFKRNVPSPYFVVPFLLCVTEIGPLTRLLYKRDFRKIGKELLRHYRRSLRFLKGQ